MMQGNYGSRFVSMWRNVDEHGNDNGMTNAMAVWGRKLAGFRDHPKAIAEVLDHLPPEPPTLPKFVELCREAARRIGGGLPRLEHRQTPEEKERADEAAKLAAQAMRRNDERDPLFWARHPGSKEALEHIVRWANAGHKRMHGVLAELVDNGIATENGKLLKRYVCNGQWSKA